MSHSGSETHSMIEWIYTWILNPTNGTQTQLKQFTTYTNTQNTNVNKNPPNKRVFLFHEIEKISQNFPWLSPISWDNISGTQITNQTLKPSKVISKFPLTFSKTLVWCIHNKDRRCGRPKGAKNRGPTPPLITIYNLYILPYNSNALHISNNAIYIYNSSFLYIFTQSVTNMYYLQ